MTKYLVVNADDLGISVSTNLAIRRAFREGIVTSTSLMANMPAFGHAVDHVVNENPGLGIGIHLCLTSGRSSLKRSQVPLLVDDKGFFKNGCVRIFGLLKSRRRAEAIQQITDEWNAQIEVLQAAGIEIDHIDSHQHVHMIPELFDVVTCLARRFPGVAVRISGERLSLAVHASGPQIGSLLSVRLIKTVVLMHFCKVNRRRVTSVHSADRFYGVLNGGRMTGAILKSIFRSAPQGITEVITHPGLPARLEPQVACNRTDRRFLKSRFREAELAALVDKSVKDELEESGVMPVRFRDISHDKEQEKRLGMLC